jgi:hypothetical protein
METENTTSNLPAYKEPKSRFSGRVFGGLIVLTVGLLLLAQRSGAYLPDWLMSWPMLLIAIGMYVGFRHSFRGPGWAILVSIGVIFLTSIIDPSLNMRHYLAPVIVIIIGLAIIFRPFGKFRDGRKKKWDESDRFGSSADAAIATGADAIPTPGDDFLDSVTIFGGVKKNIFSKNFRGGEVVTVFGGTEINLTQADSPQRIELEITQIFGGAKLIIPPHWRIHSEDVVSIFGSVEDKRPILADSNYDNSKVLVLKGTNIFGGIDIKSY